VIAVLGGGRFVNPGLSTSRFWEAFGLAFATAITVAFLEEIFFRGIVFQGLQADLGAGLATVVACAFFSLVHFMRPEKMPDISGSDPLGGFKVFIHAFDRYADFNEILPFAIGLFLIGILLIVAYLKTSALYLPIGLHASLVFYSKLDSVFFEYTARSSTKLFGSHNPYPSFLKGVDAALTWIMVVVLTIVIALIGSKLQSRGGEAPSSGKASPK
jgi:membrane protease YdiL (CAAX protease family)